MFAAFEGEIHDGRLVIPELEGRARILEGKHLLITPLEVNDKREAIGGKVIAGTYKHGEITDPNGRTHALKEVGNCPVFVVIRHALMTRITGEVFDQKYQLGAKLGDMDD